MAQIKIIGKIFGLDNSIIPNKNFSIESKGLPIVDADGVYLNFAYVKTDAQSNVKNKSGGDLYLTASDDPAVSTLCHFNLGGGYFFPFLLSSRAARRRASFCYGWRADKQARATRRMLLSIKKFSTTKPKQTRIRFI